MLVLGIDPGSQATGYALVRRLSGRYVLVDSGIIRTRTADGIPRRLSQIYDGLVAVIEASHPDCMAIEAIFRHKSSESALRLGQARGIALLAAAQHHLEVSEYNPSTVKVTVAGHGHADKGQVSRMVVRLMGLDKPLPSDASDAAAIAMTHMVQNGFRQRVAAGR